MPRQGGRTPGHLTQIEGYWRLSICTGLTVGLLVFLRFASTASGLKRLITFVAVARAVSEDATGAQCQNRYLRSLDPTLKRGPWTSEEDEHLRRAAAVFGHSWIEVAAFVEGRNNEQCRERYQEYLNPSVTKGRWTDDQDSALLKAVEEVGEGKWKEVSRVLNIGRTDNMVSMAPELYFETYSRYVYPYNSVECATRC